MNKDSLARKISNSLLKIQKEFASFMNKTTEGCSVVRMKVMFIALCSLFIGLSVWFIVDAFLSKPSLVKVNATHIHVIPLAKEKKETTILLTTEVHQRLQLFRSYMDSLQSSKTGRLIYDSILLARPGMMDSVAVLEQMYLKQQN